MFSYRAIIKKAWKEAWKNKNLWFLGIFASLAVASGSLEYEFISPTVNGGLISGSYQKLSEIFSWSELLKQTTLGLGNIFSQGVISTINALTLVLLVATFFAVIIWMSISSQAGLIDSFRKFYAPLKKKKETTEIRTELGVGGRHFWPVFGLNILIRLGIFLIMFLMNIPLLFLAAIDNRAFVAAYTIGFVILLPVAVCLSLMIKYAIAYNVLEDRSLVSSLKKAWTLFRKNWLISLEIALILFAIGFLFGFAVLFAISVAFLPLFLVATIFGTYWLAALMLILAIITTVLASAFLSVFQVGTWTNLFLELREGNGLAKLERIFQRR